MQIVDISGMQEENPTRYQALMLLLPLILHFHAPDQVYIIGATGDGPKFDTLEKMGQKNYVKLLFWKHGETKGTQYYFNDCGSSWQQVSKIQKIPMEFFAYNARYFLKKSISRNHCSFINKYGELQYEAINYCSFINKYGDELQFIFDKQGAFFSNKIMQKLHPCKFQFLTLCYNSKKHSKTQQKFFRYAKWFMSYLLKYKDYTLQNKN